MARPQARSAKTIYTVKSYCTEDSLGFLMGRCMNRITDAIDAVLAEFGINAQHFGVLHAIYRGKVRTPSELARLRFQNSAAITYTLDLLEDRKLLARSRSAEDRRVVVLELTAEGKALTASCISLVVQAQNSVLASLNSNEYAVLSSLLRRVAQSDAADSEQPGVA